jgi:hypothetical protein
MLFTVYEPNGAEAFSIESTNDMTTINNDCSLESLMPNIEEFSKECENAYDDCVKYINAVEVMSTEGFKESVKAGAKKIVEKVKAFIQSILNAIKEFVNKVVSAIIAKFAKNKPTKTGAIIASAVGRSNGSGEKFIEYVDHLKIEYVDHLKKENGASDNTDTSNNSDNNSTNEQDDTNKQEQMKKDFDSMNHTLEELDKYAQVIVHGLGVTIVNFNGADAWKKSPFVKLVKEEISSDHVLNMNENRATQLIQYYNEVYRKMITAESEYSRVQANIDNFSTNSYLKSSQYASGVQLAMQYCTGLLNHDLNGATDSINKSEDLSDSDKTAKLNLIVTMTKIVKKLVECYSKYLANLAKYNNAIKTFEFKTFEPKTFDIKKNG